MKRLIIFISIIVAPFMFWMNATPGHFDYADTDGCACFASYTQLPQKDFCMLSRERNCDTSALNAIVLFLSKLDRYK